MSFWRASACPWSRKRSACRPSSAIAARGTCKKMTNKKASLVAAALALLLGWLTLSPAPAVPSSPAGQEGPKDLVQAHDNTNFPLVGKHRTVECGDCHLQGILEGTPQACESCHWGRRHDDPYQLRLGTQCGDCHTPQAWGTLIAGAWDHEAVTGFRLEGSHRSLDCRQCHGDRGFGGTTTECSQCHSKDFERAKEPDHVAAGFPAQCEICHFSPRTWEGAEFDHDSFPLRGKHRTADCAQCHAGGEFAGISTDCVSCHLDDYQRTTSPNHQQARFPTDCAGCHGASASRWTGAVFDHDRSFPLLGKHQLADCGECHVNGQFAGTPATCVACHRDDYDRARDPNHQQSGFGTDCETCHGTAANGWEGATFDHDRFFRLEGAHRILDCQVCHSRGSNPPTDCYGCHSDDYRGARSPDHLAAGFPTACQNCHFPNHTSWNQATFRHSFPISGPHNRDCSECHRTSNFSQFSCIHCHEHEKSRMDDKHREEPGYVYDSRACLGCHSDGRE